MLMRSRDGEMKRVATTSGHIVFVGAEPMEVPDFMEVAAYQAGCIACEPQVESEEDRLMRQQLVYENMKLMVERNNRSDVSPTGDPNKSTLNLLCQFLVGPEDYELAWQRVQAEALEED